jgi:hypothetical protein
MEERPALEVSHLDLPQVRPAAAKQEVKIKAT